MIIERKKCMCVFFGWLGRGAWSNLPGHSKVHKQCCWNRVTVRRHEFAATNSRQPQQHEFSIALDGFDQPAGQILLKRSRIINEISFTEPHGYDSPADNRASQPTRYCFDFWKFWH